MTTYRPPERDEMLRLLHEGKCTPVGIVLDAALVRRGARQALADMGARGRQMQAAVAKYLAGK